MRTGQKNIIIIDINNMNHFSIGDALVYMSTSNIVIDIIGCILLIIFRKKIFKMFK